MLHMIAWSGAKTDSTANEAAPVVADNSITPSASGNRYLVPYDATVAQAFALNDTLTRARLNIPSYRDIGLPEIYPFLQAATVSANFFTANWGENGPKVRANEGIAADSSNGASTVDNITIAVNLFTGRDSIPPGRRFTLRATSAITIVANAWVTGALTFDQDLPTGKYAVIGMAGSGTNFALARLVFPMNTTYRPGAVVGNTALIQPFSQYPRYGAFGTLGYFTDRAPPQVEALGLTAGAQTLALILDCVEVTRY